MKSLLKLNLCIFLPCLLQANHLNECYQLNVLAQQAIRNDQLPQALEFYTKALTIDPSDSTVLYNCGYIYTRLNDNKNAIACYQKSLALVPDNGRAKLGLSKALLACGNFDQAWPIFEDRLANPKLMQQAFGYLHVDLARCTGKKILLRSEWGLGDMVHFVRYAKLLHDLGAYVIVQAFDPLVKLFSLCPYIDRVISIGDPIPANGIQIPMMSLPLLFKTTLDTIPAPIPYLFADQDLIQYWAHELERDKRYKIGICWHAKPIYLEDHINTRRSIPLAAFATLENLPISFYSLQKEYGMDELQSFANMQKMPADFDESHGRFMDTAALIMNLDLIISADTSIVHIAGALGKEVWVLLPYAPEWRWLPGVAGFEEKSPWYKNMRLFKQKKPGDWQAVISEVKSELRKRITCS